MHGLVTPQVHILTLVLAIETCRSLLWLLVSTFCCGGSVFTMFDVSHLCLGWWRWENGLIRSLVCTFLSALLTDVFRYNFDLITLMAESMDPIETFWVVLAWLHGTGTSAVSCFTFSSLADLYRCEFDSPTLKLMPSESIWTVLCREPCTFDSL